MTNKGMGGGSRKTVEKILTEDLGMREVSVKMASRISSHDQKQHGLMLVLFCSLLLSLFQLPEEKHSLDSYYMWLFMVLPL